MTIFFTLALLAGCAGGKDQTPTASAPLPPGTNMVLSGGVHLVEVIDGEATWDIRSARATYSTPSGFLNFDDVKATCYQRGTPVYHVVGRKGTYDSKNEVIYLSGDVVGHTTDGYTLKTDSIQHNLDTEVAQTKDRIEIRGDDLKIDGVGMIADFKAETLKILDDVQVWAIPAKISEQSEPEGNNRP